MLAEDCSCLGQRDAAPRLVGSLEELQGRLSSDDDGGPVGASYQISSGRRLQT